MALSYGNIPYTVKGTQEFLGMGFGEAKQGGHLPFGQLPLLEVGGKGGRIIAQSGAINRYVAGLSGLVPADPVDAAFCDMVYETSQELFKIQPICNLWAGDKHHEEKKEFLTNTLPARLKALAKLLADKKFFCGDKVAYCGKLCMNTFINTLYLLMVNLCRFVSVPPLQPDPPGGSHRLLPLPDHRALDGPCREPARCQGIPGEQT